MAEKKEFNAKAFVKECQKAVKDNLTIGDCAERMGYNAMTFRNKLIKAFMETGEVLPQFREGRKAQDSRNWAKVKTNDTVVLPKKYIEALGLAANGKVSFEMAEMGDEKIIAVSVWTEKKGGDDSGDGDGTGE